MATRTISKPRGRPNNRFGDRRIEVLRAAANIFSDLGFRQATLEDVARELGMTRAALYHYARSKDALLTACGDIARQQLIKALGLRSEEHTSELQSLMRISYAVFCLKKKKYHNRYIDFMLQHKQTY